MVVKRSMVSVSKGKFDRLSMSPEEYRAYMKQTARKVHLRSVVARRQKQARARFSAALQEKMVELGSRLTTADCLSSTGKKYKRARKAMKTAESRPVRKSVQAQVRRIPTDADRLSATGEEYKRICKQQKGALNGKTSKALPSTPPKSTCRFCDSTCNHETCRFCDSATATIKGNTLHDSTADDYSKSCSTCRFCHDTNSKGSEACRFCDHSATAKDCLRNTTSHSNALVKYDADKAAKTTSQSRELISRVRRELVLMGIRDTKFVKKGASAVSLRVADNYWHSMPTNVTPTSPQSDLRQKAIKLFKQLQQARRRGDKLYGKLLEQNRTCTGHKKEEELHKQMTAEAKREVEKERKMRADAEREMVEKHTELIEAEARLELFRKLINSLQQLTTLNVNERESLDNLRDLCVEEQKMKVETLEEKNASLSSELVKAQTSIRTLEAQLADSVCDWVAQLSAMQLVTDTNKQLKEAVNERQRMINKLQKQLQQGIYGDVDELVSRSQSSRALHNAHQDEVDALSRQLVNANQKCQMQAAELETLERLCDSMAKFSNAEMEKLVEENGDLKTQLQTDQDQYENELVSRTHQLEHLARSMETNKAAHQSQVDALSGGIAALSERLQNAKSERDASVERLKAIRLSNCFLKLSQAAQINKLTKKNRLLQQEIDALTKRSQEQSSLHEMQMGINDANHELRQLRANTLSQKLDTMTNLCSRQEKELAQLKEAHDESQRIGALQSELSCSKSESLARKLNVLKKRHDDQTVNLAALMAEHEVLKEHAEHLANENECLSSKLDTMSKWYAKEASAAAHLRKTTEDMKSEHTAHLNALSRTNSNLCSQLESAMQREEQKDAELAVTRRSLTEVRSTKKELSKENKNLVWNLHVASEKANACEQQLIECMVELMEVKKEEEAGKKTIEILSPCKPTKLDRTKDTDQNDGTDDFEIVDLAEEKYCLVDDDNQKEIEDEVILVRGPRTNVMAGRDGYVAIEDENDHEQD